MQTRNMEKSENNHQFKIIFNYDIFIKYIVIKNYIRGIMQYTVQQQVLRLFLQ